MLRRTIAFSFRSIGTSMPGISDTIRQFQDAFAGGLPRNQRAAPTRLCALSDFGMNPGELKAWIYVPDLMTSMPLVVVLHGCTQTAVDYDIGSGWSELAERYGFAVLFPEQQRANNPNLCFNWFQPGDTVRDGGEASSIVQMMNAVALRHLIDPTRVFVTGLSAGGAMANVMLATHPERFAGGAVIAGLPYGAANSVTQAMQKMRGTGHVDEARYADIVRRASGHTGPWPTISVWHGDADHTVHVSNADATVAQWLGIHGLGTTPDRLDIVEGHRHRVWYGPAGHIAVEDYRIAGFGHGTPLKTRGPGGCGSPGPHMLEAGISSTWQLASSWDILRHNHDTLSSAKTEAAGPAFVRSGNHRAPLTPGIAATIEQALRSAGLMP